MLTIEKAREHHRPDFFWDYDLTEEDVRAILAGDDVHLKAWVMSRILNAASWEDIWKYLTLEDIRTHFHLLSFRTPELRDLWAHALEVWSQQREREGSWGVAEERPAYLAEPDPVLQPGILTALQDTFLRRFFAYEVGNTFFLTGGTALAAFYLHHRLSEDLDLFTVEERVLDAAVDVVLTLGDEMGWDVRLQRLSPHLVRVSVAAEEGELLRVELVQDVGPQFGQKRWCEGIHVDALPNIAANKVTAILGRSDVKDFVDLYFILRRWNYDFATLLGMAKQKDKGLTEFYLAGAMHQVGRVKVLPRMLEPVDLEDVVAFYKDLADELLARNGPPRATG